MNQLSKQVVTFFLLKLSVDLLALKGTVSGWITTNNTVFNMEQIITRFIYG